MAPNTAGSIPEPEGALRAAIDQQFGSFQDFTKAFTNAALKLFGSGWTWLYFDTTSGQLALTSTQNQDTPAMVATRIPLLGLDVWEHVRRLILQCSRFPRTHHHFGAVRLIISSIRTSGQNT